ncbi:MAG: PA2779 family protein [Gemmatimonadota bacterium]
MRRTRVAAAIGLFLLVIPTVAQAQEHTTTQQDLDAMVAAHTDELNANRAVVEAFLARPEVARIAADAGIDVRLAEGAVATLSPEDMEKLAVRLDRLDSTLAGGGDAITIQTTTLIIVLLVLILIL